MFARILTRIIKRNGRSKKASSVYCFVGERRNFCIAEMRSPTFLLFVFFNSLIYTIVTLFIKHSVILHSFIFVQRVLVFVSHIIYRILFSVSRLVAIRAYYRNVTAYLVKLLLISRLWKSGRFHDLV